MLDRIIDGTFVFLPVAPLMHAAGQWTSLSWLFAGGKVVLLPGSLDPEGCGRPSSDEKVNSITVVGDPVVRPLVDAWDAEPDAGTSRRCSRSAPAARRCRRR